MLFQRQSLLILLTSVTSVGAFTITNNAFLTPSCTRPSISDSRLYFSDVSPTVESSSDDADAATSEATALEAVVEDEAPESLSDGDDDAVASTEETEEEEVPIESSSDDGVVAADDEESKEGPTRKKREKRPHTAYVVNLSYETTNGDLRTVFSEYGKVESVYVPMDRKNDRPKGIAFVSMSSEDELEAALEGLQELELGGRRIFVNKAKKKEDGDNTKPDPLTKLYLGNISFETTKEDILDHFSQYGPVKDCYIPTSRDTGLPRGFAFLTMNKEGCEAAIAGADGMEFGGRDIEVKHSLPRGTKAPRREREPQTKLYIGNLSYQTEEEVLREVFEQYGTITDLYMPYDRYSGERRGFAFITVHPDVAVQIVEELDGFELDGRMLRVNEARPKGQAPPVDNYDDSNGYDDNYDGFGADSYNGDESYNGDDGSYDEGY